MSGGRPNELEERRVIRLLSEVAGAVEPLPLQDVDALLRSAAVGRDRRRQARRLATPQARALLATAAAAAVIVGTTLASMVPGSQPSSSGPGTAHAQLTSFPEGSALQLLLSNDGVERAS